MPDLQVIGRELTIHFARSVSFPDQKPALMQVTVTPLAEPSSPAIGATFVKPDGTQQVLLAHSDNPVTFTLIPSHLAGLTHELLYRIAWRAGVTGRTHTFDFAMPDDDVNFDDLADLGKIIDGQVYLRQTDLGTPGRIARLDTDGDVVDADGHKVVSVGDFNNLSARLDTEVDDRTHGDQAVALAAQSNLDTKAAQVAAEAAANLDSAIDDTNFAIGGERAARILEDTNLSGRIDGLTGDLSSLSSTVSGHTDDLTGKADLDGDGHVLLAQIPVQAQTTSVHVADETEMLALTSAQVRRYDYARRPDGVFVLLGGDDPSHLPNWVKLNQVSSVNGRAGTVVLNLSDVAAEGGSVDIGQVDGLQTALDAAADDTELSALTGRVEGIETDTTIVKTSGGVIDHALNDEHMAYLNDDGKITDKAGTVITVPGTGSVTEINGHDGIVTLDLSDVAAAGGQAPIDQVDGLQDALDDKIAGTDPRLGDAREPTAHADTHKTTGTDPLVLRKTQITGLDDTLDDHSQRLGYLEAHGGSGTGSGGGAAKANWFSGIDTFTATDPADFFTQQQVGLRGPFAQKPGGGFVYHDDGVADTDEEYLWAYISPNGHLQLRRWDETGDPDPEPATQDALDALGATVADKADDDDLNTLNTTVVALSATVDGKADTATVTALSTQLNGDLTSLQNTVGDKADTTTVSALGNDITALQTGKADLDAGGHIAVEDIPDLSPGKITGLLDALGAKADLDGNTLDVEQMPDHIPMANIADLDTALEAKADLVDGKLATAQIPDLALTTTTVVDTKAEMLAQTTGQVQPGDLTVITGSTDRGNYILKDPDPTDFDSWVKMVVPEGSVSSVNGQSGTVVLTAADIGARPAADDITIADVVDLQNELDDKATVAALDAALTDKATVGELNDLIADATPNKQRVARATTTRVASLSGAQSVDGQLVHPGTLVLLAGQSSAIDNGLWLVASGAWQRPDDFKNGSFLVRGALVVVKDGSADTDTLWQQTAASGTVGSDENHWAKIGHLAAPFDAEAGHGITIDAGVFAVKPDTGIAVTAAGVGVDTDVVARKKTGYVPSGSATATITHNLGTDAPLVQLFEAASGEMVLAGVTMVDPDTIRIYFEHPPGTSEFRYVVIG